jgi:opine dehydrogenase
MTTIIYQLLKSNYLNSIIRGGKTVSKPNVCILGGGNGAFAYAADLKLKGSRVSLYELPEFYNNIAGASKDGGIKLEVRGNLGPNPGFAKIDLITSDIKAAVEGAEIIFLVVPSFAQKSFAKVAAPHLVDGQIVVLSPSNFGGSIEFANIMEESGNTANITIVETECMMYSGFKDSPSSVWISGYKLGMKAAAYPASKTAAAMKIINQVYPEWEPAENILETGLRNVNTVFHAPIMVLNAGRVESPEEFLFYWDGCTPSVGRVVETVEKERLAIGKALGINLTPNLQVLIDWYGHSGCKGTTLTEAMATNPVYKWDTAPKSLQHRFILEDIPYGMVPMESLGKAVEVSTPATTAIIELSSILVGKDLRAEARDLNYLGIAHLGATELIKYVKSVS